MAQYVEQRTAKGRIGVRTITALDGPLLPSASDTTVWPNAIANGDKRTAIAWTNLSIRGSLVTLNNPVLTVRPVCRRRALPDQVTIGDECYWIGPATTLTRERNATNLKFFYRATGNIGDTPVFTDGSATVIAGGTLSLSSVNATSSSILIGSTEPAAGLDITVVSGATAGTLVVQYHDGTAFVARDNVTDGTALAGQTLAQSGQITWDLPTDEALNAAKTGTTYYNLYWTRLSFTGASIALGSISGCAILRPIKQRIILGAHAHDMQLMVQSIASSVTDSGTLTATGSVEISLE